MAQNKKKMKVIQSTQSFSPVREIKDGIICTKDGRYVELLEFSPVNFSLRSADEQAQIVNMFAGVLKSLPQAFHFKVVQQRANVQNIINVLRNHYNQEDNARCQRLQLEQMEMLKDAGFRNGVSRRFFMSYEYEEPAFALSAGTNWDKISKDMANTELGIRNAMEACGNECITPVNDSMWTMKTFYSIYSRVEASRMSFRDKQLSTVARYASQQGYDFENHNYVLPTNDLLAPALIDDSASPSYLVVQGGPDSPPLYYTFAYIPGKDYPARCLAGWLNILINTGPGIDVDIFCQRKDPARLARTLSFTLRSKKSSMNHMDDSRSDYDELAETINSGYYIKQGLSSGEDLYDFGVMLTITANSPDELNERYHILRQFMEKRDLGLKRCTFQMLDAFKSSLPTTSMDKSIFAKAKRNILGSQLASIYPFISYEMSDADGIFFGFQNNGSMVLLNNFDTDKYNNANMCILGSSGAGKTYTLSCMALRFREKQVQTFIIAPDKGHEFKRGCDAIGGSYIRIAPGSPQNINIMDIRKKDDQATLALDGEDSANSSILAEKIQSLHTFVSLIVPDIGYEEKQLLDEALIRTYANFGITIDNQSLIDPEYPSQYRPMPLLGDLHKELEPVPEAKRIYNALTRFVTGSASSFNAPTNVNLDNKYIVLDVSKLTDELLPVGMYIALDYVWDKAREDRTKKKIIFMDEVWKLIGASASPLAAKFVVQIFKVIRGYGGAAVAATQDLNDFIALNNGEFGNAIINNSEIKFIMRTKRKEIASIQELLGLTTTEKEEIIATKKGSGLLVANSNHVFIQVQASRTEHDLITTDRNDLERIARSA